MGLVILVIRPVSDTDSSVRLQYRVLDRSLDQT